MQLITQYEEKQPQVVSPDAAETPPENDNLDGLRSEGRLLIWYLANKQPSDAAVNLYAAMAVSAGITAPTCAPPLTRAIRLAITISEGFRSSVCNGESIEIRTRLQMAARADALVCGAAFLPSSVPGRGKTWIKLLGLVLFEIFAIFPRTVVHFLHND